MWALIAVAAFVMIVAVFGSSEVARRKGRESGDGGGFTYFGDGGDGGGDGGGGDGGGGD